jgi:hypothetical protein
MLTGHERELLLDIADAAIAGDLLGAPPSASAAEPLTGALREHVGVFVTLMVDGQLNGCIGSIDGVEPLGHAAARLAWSAAFADPRLPRLRPVDYSRLRIEVSVLSPLTAMLAVSRHQVLDQLRPGVDGLVIAAGSRKGLFLPAMWEQLPEPEVFLDHLLLKVGLVPGRWPEGMRAWWFTAETFARDVGERPNPSQAA